MLLRPAKEGDRAKVEALLQGGGLPLDGVAEHFNTFVVAEDGARIAGAAGLEMHGVDALLRSVVIAPEARGGGLASRLVRQALNDATARGAAAVYLLTTTAASFFPRFGFEPIGWDDVPTLVRESREFCGACPSSAVAMRVALDVVEREPSP